ncbi:hypothetical protein M432DRAFT_232214 [Thermoascus aurantiacus ATCC 26904]
MPSALSTYMSTCMSFAVSAAILRSCLLVRTFQDLVSLRRATPWAWRRWRAVPPSGVDHEAHFPPVARRRFVDRSHVPDWVLVGFLVQIIYPCDSFCSPCLDFFFFFLSGCWVRRHARDTSFSPLDFYFRTLGSPVQKANCLPIHLEADQCLASLPGFMFLILKTELAQEEMKGRLEPDQYHGKDRDVADETASVNTLRAAGTAY